MANRVVKTKELLHYGTARPITYPGNGTGARKEDLDAMDSRSYLKYFGGTHRMTQEQLIEYTKKRKAEQKTKKETDEVKEELEAFKNGSFRLGSTFSGGGTSARKEDLDAMDPRSYLKYFGGTRRMTQEQLAEYIKKIEKKNAKHSAIKVDTKTPVEQLYHKDTDEFLAHHGILGMKWGFRRFQNEDGTRTAAGKRREAARGIERSEDYLKSRESKGKGPEGLSNEELRRLNERLQLETTYKNLTAEKMVKAESFVGKAIKTAAGAALTDFSKGLFLGAAKMLVKEISPVMADMAFGIKQPVPTTPAAAAPKPGPEKKQTKK